MNFLFLIDVSHLSLVVSASASHAEAPGSIPGMVTESANGTLHMTCPLLNSGINEYI